ncbi:ATP-binding cassette sub-family F member 3 isoform X1 [Rousettus aegyptiacus]|uniref:ATP-binding cassette sub-family F member 3 n=2 Tax=Rousettus aegyptiacus TaxID=9407 RepID=A0A7J8HL11_ROUAE|nr:ATP-binding cassette sub-family F member 3 isoform X1 [Rousettus aegyptiacus]KAF6473007.1 ATP binding cassette subfamily F member 3 [Rousettus aegyptiacus]
MATCAEILRSEFPEIDGQVFDYVTGVLHSGSADFESVDDLVEAVGELLQEVSGDSKDDAGIRAVCQRMYNTLRLAEPQSQGNSQVLLDAPIQLSKITENYDCGTNLPGLLKREQSSTVNAKKLEKAEARLKAKQEKRSEKDTLKTSSPLVLEEASASQAGSRKESRLESSGKNKSYDVRIENFDVSFGDRVLLAGADVNLAWGRRYGLVGRNGLGKTTLLKMLATRSLRVPAHISLLHVEQEVAGDDTPALQSVLESDTVREDLLRQERELSAQIAAGRAKGSEAAQLAEIYAKLEEIEADKAPARASVILAGLGFTPKMQQQPTREFSGGWRMRLALARALFARPDLLLLDEPTNMLDVRAILWLENYLQTWPSTILVISHDRNFLNAIATDIIHLHSQRLDGYRGDFETFIKSKQERLLNQQREYEAQQQYRQHIQVFIDRFRYNANRASQVQSKLKMLEKLPELKPVDKELEVVMKFPDGFEKFSPPILQLDEVDFYYDPKHVIFSRLSVSADLESRICVVGENGAGKSTMLKLLMGDLTPVQGIRHAHRNLKIGYFSQHHVEQLDLNVSAVELLARKFPGRPEEEYRHQLGRYGISGELAMRPVASLSGGQKSRVAFAQMTMPCPNFYILDEPTNHLDMETIEALGRALNNFRGGVILVSHDERFIQLVCQELWVCEGGGVTRVEGGFDQYRALLQEQFRREGFL